MSATDAMIRRLEAEFEERQAFIEGMIAGAQEKGRDLNSEEMKMIGQARERQQELLGQLEPLQGDRGDRQAVPATHRRARRGDPHGPHRGDSSARSSTARRPTYIADVWSAQMGDHDAQNRLGVFHRAAAHQTTADNAGLLPESIVEPVLNFVDNSRPLVNAIGTTDLGTGSWAYAKVTQHTQVDVQSAEKAELASRKMLITKTSHHGTDLRRLRQRVETGHQPDLAADPRHGHRRPRRPSTPSRPSRRRSPTCSPGRRPARRSTPRRPQAEVAAALWGAAATAYSNVRGGGRLILAVHPTDLALFGPLFAPVNPQNAYSTGFNAGEFGSGAMGSISGIQVVMSPGFAAAGQALVINTRGVRLFETRYGALQVNEPSVWGVQVGYAGDFETAIVQTGSIISIDTAP